MSTLSSTPPWHEYSERIGNVTTRDFDDQSSQLARDLCALDAWARSHLPPLPNTGDAGSKLPQRLCECARIALAYSQSVSAGQLPPIAAQALSTTAHFLHAAYLDGRDTLEPQTAAGLATQVAKSGMLEVFVQQVPAAAQQLAAEGTCSASSMQYCYALLQLVLAVHNMWPGDLYKSKVAAPAVAAAVQLAVPLIWQASRQLQLQLQHEQQGSGLRANSIMNDAMHLTQMLVNYFHPRVGELYMPLVKPLLMSPHLLLLTLLLYEQQAQQLELATPTGTAESATAAQAAGHISSSSSGCQEQQEGLAPLLYQYRRLLLGQPTQQLQQQQQGCEWQHQQQQLWAALCSLAPRTAQCSASDLAVTLQVIAKLCSSFGRQWAMDLEDGAERGTHTFSTSGPDNNLLQPLLLLPAILLHRVAY